MRPQIQAASDSSLCTTLRALQITNFECSAHHPVWLLCEWILNLTCCFLFYQGRQKDATVGQQRLGHDLMQNLRELINPFFLRRTKEDVGLVDSGQSSGKDESSGRAGGAKYVMVLLFCQSSGIIGSHSVLWHLSGIGITLYYQGCVLSSPLLKLGNHHIVWDSRVIYVTQCDEKWLWRDTTVIILFMPLVLWHCWLGGRKGIQPENTRWWDAWVVMCLGQGADLHIARLMPLSLTISCSSKSRLALPSWF